MKRCVEAENDRKWISMAAVRWEMGSQGHRREDGDPEM